MRLNWLRDHVGSTENPHETKLLDLVPAFTKDDVGKVLVIAQDAKTGELYLKWVVK